MSKMEKIDQILCRIDEEKPNYLDKLSDYEVNNIEEVKEVLGFFKIEGFSVKRDNQMKRLAGGELENIGGNRLIGFKYTLVCS